jgi:hypothetical protein
LAGGGDRRMELNIGGRGVTSFNCKFSVQSCVQCDWRIIGDRFRSRSSRGKTRPREGDNVGGGWRRVGRGGGGDGDGGIFCIQYNNKGSRDYLDIGIYSTVVTVEEAI